MFRDAYNNDLSVGDFVVASTGDSTCLAKVVGYTHCYLKVRGCTYNNNNKTLTTVYIDTSTSANFIKIFNPEIFIKNELKLPHVYDYLEKNPIINTTLPEQYVLIKLSNTNTFILTKVQTEQEIFNLHKIYSFYTYVSIDSNYKTACSKEYIIKKHLMTFSKIKKLGLDNVKLDTPFDLRQYIP